MMSFEISGEFPATHRIRIDARGTLEPLHAHGWRVRALLRRDPGDDTSEEPPGDGASDAALVHRAREALRAWIARHEGRCFNDLPPFDEVNPTAEEVARVLSRHLEESLAGARVLCVEVGEAMGFSAAYWPRGDPATVERGTAGEADEPRATGGGPPAPDLSD